MGNRLDLHDILVGILGSDEVHYQPPPSYQLNYPCIVYERSDIQTKHADNKPYIITHQYLVTVIELDADSPIPDKVVNLPRCAFSRHFTKDNLYHDVFVLTF